MKKADSTIDARTHETASQRKDRVEGKLRELQDANRLGIHMFEHCSRFTYFPDHSQLGFSALQGQSIREVMKHYEYGKTPLVSLSLVPPDQAKYKPFHIAQYANSRLGYLVDLSQYRDNPALVARAVEFDLGSGYDFHTKDLWFHEPRICSLSPILKELHEGETAESFIAKVCAEGSDLSAVQLDALADIYCNPDIPNRHCDEYSEVVACASNDHIAAITYHTASKHPLGGDMDYDHTLARLVSAMSAYDHANHGVDVPAVIYDIDVPRQQAVEYVGEGKPELKQVIIESLASLDQQHRKKLHDLSQGWADIVSHVSQLFGQSYRAIERQVDQYNKTQINGL